jgi:hypothetical protein
VAESTKTKLHICFSLKLKNYWGPVKMRKREINYGFCKWKKRDDFRSLQITSLKKRTITLSRFQRALERPTTKCIALYEDKGYNSTKGRSLP